MWFSQCLVGTRQNPRRRRLTKVGRCGGVGGRAESKTAGENVGRMSELGNHCKSCTSEQPHQQPSAAAAMRIVPRRDESCWLALFPSVLCFSDPLHACSEEDTAAETAFSSRASQSPAFGGTAMRRRTDRRAISFCRVVFFFLGGILSSDDFSQHKSSTLAWAVRRYESSLFCHEFLFGSNSR